ncbi:MAG: adenosylmethionine decarboxylase [Desulfomonilia bacterium]|jgi:S-adenosylmethionine decarboxylase proenzyme|nr:adenosylmethionine decarboxylase [Deltaproteobacteria bacterium]MDX9761592.1 adenosylmethionine decarboxylase [Desulfomonilia bacterium]HPW68473.1 adenosylmethionine decarboxylase [Deltaproteobacteria bacterium]
MTNALGTHILAEYYDCDAEVLNNARKIEKHLNDAALEAGATIVSSAFHTFNPHGVSGFVVIAESHLSIHTWPEYGYAAVDIFTCGDTVDPWKAFDLLKETLDSVHYSTIEMKRGRLKVAGQELKYKPDAVAAAVR